HFVGPRRSDRRQEPAYYRDTFRGYCAPNSILERFCTDSRRAGYCLRPRVACALLIRETQRKLVSHEWNVRLGADMDYIFMHWRPDDCHWGNMGAKLAVRMWLYALSE